MKRKIKSLLIAAVTGVLLLTGCGNKNDKEIALINNGGNADASLSIQAAWIGIEEYAAENDVTYASYQTADKTKESTEETIEQAIDAGAKVIVCHGSAMQETVYDMQKKHKKTKFILIEGTPKNDKKDEKIRDNTCTIHFAVEQAGFLAGYAAVKEGYRQLGFLCGKQTKTNTLYGSGFIQGAEYAANENALGAGEVVLNYHYFGENKLSPAYVGYAKSWYQNGTEIIMTGGGLMDTNIIKAAEGLENKKMICMGEDKSEESDIVVTSAMKDIAGGLENVLAGYYADKFPEGESLRLTAAEQGVKLPMETSRFSNFNETDYSTVMQNLANGTITVKTEDIAGGAATMDTALVTINVV